MTTEHAQKAVKTRSKTIENERKRIRLGLPQLTKLRLIEDKNIGRKINNYKSKLKMRYNYFSDYGSNLMYYDELTTRSLVAERRYGKFFTFLPADGFDPIDSKFKRKYQWHRKN